MTAGLAFGCVPASATVVYDQPAEYVEVAEVPPTIYYEPYVYYRGRPAYYVSGRWYYRYSGRWVVFRDEPRELRTYRAYPTRMHRRPHRVPAHVRTDRRYR
jgi:hypothetical protein